MKNIKLNLAASTWISAFWQKISSESFNGICHKKKIQESTEICGPAAQKNTFSKIIRQRKSSNWMRQIGSMLRELLLTIFLTCI